MGTAPTRNDIDESFLPPEIVPKEGVQYFDTYDWEFTVTKEGEGAPAHEGTALGTVNSIDYWPFFFSQSCICAISVSCALMIASASFFSSGSLPKAISTLAMSMAPA